MTKSHLVFFDLETAGLDPKRHPIIQIAAIAVDESLSPVEAFEAKIRFDEKKANKNSLRKNHFHRGVWAKDAQEERQVAIDFAEFLRRHAAIDMKSSSGHTFRVAQLVAHNASFDGTFLQDWFDRIGIFLPARRQVLCTLQRAMWWCSENPTLFLLAISNSLRYASTLVCHFTQRRPTRHWLTSRLRWSFIEECTSGKINGIIREGHGRDTAVTYDARGRAIGLPIG